jgi:hypothetical protein
MDTPRASRPYRALLLALARIVEDDSHLSMSETQFVGAVMKAAGGGVSPAVVSQEYHRLIAEAAGASGSPAYSSYLNRT